MATENLPVNQPSGSDIFIFPMSFAQQRLWFLDQFEPGNVAYNLLNVYRLAGPLGIDALKKSVESLIQRHESLRTTFGVIDQQPSQIVHETWHNTAFEVIDLAAQAFENNEKQALSTIVDEARKPFDLTTGPLIRVLLFRLGENIHLFALLIHHIVTDGWSQGILFKELSAFYQAAVSGDAPQIPDLEIQYPDYTLWQREYLSGDTEEKMLAYWKQQLDSAQILELPTNYARPPMQTFNGALFSFSLPDELVNAVKSLAQQESVSLYMLLLAAFNVLLYHYTHQTDILVGSPIAGRNLSEIEGVIGLFVNTLVLRTTIAPDVSFRRLVKQVRETALNAYAHQDVPFEKLVDEIHMERDLSRNPLIQTTFSLQNFPPISFQLPGVFVEEIQIDRGISKMDLEVYLTEEKGRITGNCYYNTDLFDPVMIEQIIHHYQQVLSQIGSAPDQRISEINVLTKDEEQKILWEWNQTTLSYPSQTLIHQLIEEQVKATPNRVAAVFGDESISYQELNARSNQITNYLLEKGVKPGQFVGICLDRSLDLLAAVFGVFKAGCAYLPLDPDYPPARLNFMLNDSGTSVAIIHTAHAHLFDPNKFMLLQIDQDGKEISRLNDHRVEMQGALDQLAYLIYTSGSTGKPKGVRISHRNVVNFLTAMKRRPGFSAGDTLLAVTTLSFDISVLELFLPLVSGGTVVIASQNQSKDSTLLSELISQSGATVMQATPATWQMLLMMGWEGDPNLRVFCGGDRLSGKLAAELLPRCKELWNMYGPTETTVWSLVHRVETLEDNIPIGIPIPNTRVYVLDNQMQPVPVGVVGELYIGGDGVSCGYHGRNDLTAERFVELPEGLGLPDELRSVYRTGDLVKWQPNGILEIVGRADHQVKLRGFRIELGEIEAVIRRHPEIADVVVLVWRSDDKDQGLCAYLTLRQTATDGQVLDQVKAHAREYLPAYMVPSWFVFVDEFPLTPNGKIDRRGFPAPVVDAGKRQDRFAAPESDLEKQLVKIWEEMLGVKPMGVHANFFELGGHSLLAVQLIMRIEHVLGVKLPVATFFQAPTVKGQAALLEQGGWDSYWAPLVPVQSQGTNPPLFCVAAMGGNVLTYRDLAIRLGTDQPVYALQSRGLDGITNPISQVDEMASLFIQAIKAIQPEGPYQICGSSFGGNVAYEMACQLMENGQVVSFLGLFDAYGPSYRDAFRSISPLQRKALDFLDRILLHLRNLWIADWKGKMNYVTAKSKRLNRKLKKSRRKAKLLRTKTLPKEIQNVQEANRLALRAYKPSKYSGNVRIFQASHQPYGMPDDPTLGWRELVTGEIESYIVEGHHGALVYEPQVKNLAPLVQACLEETKASLKNKPPDS